MRTTKLRLRTCAKLVYHRTSSALLLIKVLQELRTFMDSTLMIDPELVTDSVRTLALNTLTAYQNGVSLKWNDAELAVYLVYIFGEINKCEYHRF